MDIQLLVSPLSLGIINKVICKFRQNMRVGVFPVSLPVCLPTLWDD